MMDDDDDDYDDDGDGMAKNRNKSMFGDARIYVNVLDRT